MKQSASQTGDEKQHQGVHPGSTTQSPGAGSDKKTGSRGTPGRDKHAGEQVVEKKERYASEE